MSSLLAIGSAALDIKTRRTRAPVPTTDVPGQITLKPGGARAISPRIWRASACRSYLQGSWAMIRRPGC
jgi:hypothetical protein